MKIYKATVLPIAKSIWAANYSEHAAGDPISITSIEAYFLIDRHAVMLLNLVRLFGLGAM